jgi:hypothetical protein
MKAFLCCLACAACSHETAQAAFDLTAVADDLGDHDSAAGADSADAARDLSVADHAPAADDDWDGLDDAEELAWAQAYLPYLSLSPQDKCPTGGLVVRVTTHKDDASLLHIVYDYLYDEDCGLGGHPGDDEVFALTVNPQKPPPEGIVAMKAISHQGTLCERDSTCGRCSGLTACATLPKSGVAWPAVWPSRDKHGSYVNKSASCTTFGTCFDQCDDNSAPASPPMVNAGEPGHPLVNDLTDHGFITAANGWKNQQLFHYDPWSGKDFGNAGNVAADLADSAFDTPACP